MFKIDKKYTIPFLSFLVRNFYIFESWFFNCKNVNYPKDKPVIFAMLHSHQCGIYTVKKEGVVNVLVSKSNDGNIVATASEGVGLKVIRGSHKKAGAASASIKMVEKLEQGENVAIAIDGPRGPMGVVKEGIITIAKLSQAPIVPMTWHSPSKWLLKFNTWDSFRFPLLGVKTVALYGEPIYVPADCSKEDVEIYRQKVETALKELHKDVQENFKEYRQDY